MSIPVDQKDVANSIREEVDDALLLLQYAVAKGMTVPPSVIYEILKSASVYYPDAFSAADEEAADEGDISRDLEGLMARINEEKSPKSQQAEQSDEGEAS
jgi:hypothetical protein